MKIPYNILIQIKMSVRPYFKGFTLIFSSITVENRILDRSALLVTEKAVCPSHNQQPCGNKMSVCSFPIDRSSGPYRPETPDVSTQKKRTCKTSSSNGPTVPDPETQTGQDPVGPGCRLDL